MEKPDLDKIGFYSLSNHRADNASNTSQMQRCEMIIIEDCNFNCPYCKGLDEEIFSDRRRKLLSFEEIKRNIDLWCKDKPLKNIRFSGGEPTLHPDIVKIIEYAKLKDIERIAISTNGSASLELYLKLVVAGANDFSVSLDSANATTGDKMAGDKSGAWDRVISTIKFLSQSTYVTVGIVLTEDNIGELVELVRFASDLGVADIRVISAAQWDRPLEELRSIPQSILDKHPILAYRVKSLIAGKSIRGIASGDVSKCGLVLDDSVIAGKFHYPCVIYMRERGSPVGIVNPNMRLQRLLWFRDHDSKSDPICNKNCLDVCIDYNNRFAMSRNETIKV